MAIHPKQPKKAKDPEVQHHPQQPVFLDPNGTARFKGNAIISYLFDEGLLDLNKIAGMSFSKEDRMQIAQLLGYSVGGYADLSYASGESIATADRAARELADK